VATVCDQWCVVLKKVTAPSAKIEKDQCYVSKKQDKEQEPLRAL
jgi:hypothetical protein